MSSPSTIKTDKYAFTKYMKNIGRAYRKQAKELVSMSRIFVQAQNQSNADPSLERVLQAVDDALRSAVEAEKKTSNGANEAFKNAVNMLTDYGRNHHRDSEEAVRVAEKMEKAEEEDKSSLKVLNRLKATFRPLEEEPTMEVEFLLHKSLPDKDPTIVTQVLGKSSNISEVLWNFSRYKGNKRLTLKQNPHFYRDLPRRYEDDFESNPIEEFLDALGDFKGGSLDKPKPKISVLTDRQGRIYLGSGRDPRAFGNVWCPQNAIIFKDVCGKLEGEKIVGSSIEGQSNLQYCEEPSPTSANTMEWKPLQDWTEPIRRLLNSKSPDRDFSNIHIVTEQSNSHKSHKVSPSISNHRPSGSSNSLKRTGSGDTPTFSEPIQPQPVITEGISSKDGAGARSPPSSAPTQHLLAVKVEALSDQKRSPSPPPPSVSTQPLLVTSNLTQSSRQPPPLISSPLGRTTPVVPIPSIAQLPPPSSASTQPLPVAPNHGLAQSSRKPPPPISSPPDRTTPVVPISSIAQPPPPSSASTQPLLVAPNHGPTKPSRQPPPDRTTPVIIPLTKPTPPSQHQAPPNVSQDRQLQACTFSNETLNISVKVGMTSQFSQNIAITSHISRDGSSRNVASHADPLVSKPEGPTSKAPKPDVTPPQPQKTYQRPVWQAWFQKIWTGGK